MVIWIQSFIAGLTPCHPTLINEVMRMTEEELMQIESSQRQHNQIMLHQSRISFAVEQEELGRFSLLKPLLLKDGSQWCVLYGKDLQEGIAGFGSTPNKAIRDWNKQWDKEQ